MEYIESLLEEYFQKSFELDSATGLKKKDGLLEELLSIEEEICFEASLPISENNRNLFRLIGKNKSQNTYIQESIQNLMRAKTKYIFHTKELMVDLFKAA